MRVLFLTEGIDVPASRFRAEHFFPGLEALGIHCTLMPAYGRLYNRAIHAPWGVPYKLACRLKRGAATLGARGYDVLFLQRTALPHSALPEVLGAKLGHRLVFDFDDAIMLSPDGSEDLLRRRAFDAAVHASRHVIAGNQWLAEKAGAPEKTTVIPTVLDTDLYTPEVATARPEVVIGWMGSATNIPGLRSMIPDVLEVLRARPRTVFRIVTNAVLPDLAALPGVEVRPWSRATELADLRDFDLGLMPLADNPVILGKCAFKMIQYMAVEVPYVASALGANLEVHAGSGGGFLVNQGDSWVEPLLKLVDDAASRRTMGQSGRAHAVQHYSIHAVLGRYVEIFKSVAS